MQAVTIKDLFGVKFLSDMNMAPDGCHAAFVVAQGNVEENNYKSNIWLYRFEDGALKQLTAMDSEKNIAWLDNETIIFPTMRLQKDKDRAKKGEDLTVYYCINIHGGEAVRAFELPLKSGVLKKVDDTTYLTTAVYDNARPDLSGMDDAEKEKTIKQLKEDDAAFHIFDEIPFWANGKGIINKKRTRLYICNTKDGAQTAISPPLMNVAGYKYVQEAGKVLYYGVEYDNMMVRESILHIYDIHMGTDMVIPTSKPFSIQTAEIIGGEIILYGLPSDDLGSCKNARFYKLPLNGGMPQLFSDIDVSLGSAVGSDCKFGSGTSFRLIGDTMYYCSTRGYSSYLFKLDKNGGEARVSPDVTGCVDSFGLAGGQAIYIAFRNKGLAEVYTLDLSTGEEKCVSSFNQEWLQNHAVSYPEHFVMVNRDGVELDGFVIKPVGFEKGKSYPAILDMHGGPKVTYGDVFFHEMQLWAGEGYFVFFTNPRGSDGKGSEFAEINGEKYGRDDYNDFMDFTDKVLELYPQIDEKRVGVTGGSYGGLMTNWIVGHTDRFAAAATQRSIANFVSKCLTTDIGYFHNLAQMQADPWNGADIMWDHSPLKYADQCKTPLLFIHSDEDYRCYMADAFQLFTALKMHGVDSRLCLFHGENHELSRSGKPKNRMKRLQEITDWFNKYLK